MPKEVLLYGSVGDRSAAEFIEKVDAVVAEGEDLVVRVNTPGGNPEYGWGMVAKFLETPGTKLVKVDGKAYSFGTAFCVYAEKKNVECLDVSEFLFHRAAYPLWYEKDYLSEAGRENLVRINKSLEKAFRNRVDVKLFEELTGVTVKEIFSMDDRVDVFFDSKVAKKIGLVGKVNKITPEKQTEIDTELQTYTDKFGGENKLMEIAASFSGVDRPQITSVEDEPEKVEDVQTSKIEKMNREELKSKHPELYKSIFDEGVSSERDRVGAFLVHITADPKAVIEGINSGKELSQTQREEFMVARANKKQGEKVEGENAPALETEEPETPVEEEETPASKALSELEATIDEELGLTEEEK